MSNGYAGRAVQYSNRASIKINIPTGPTNVVQDFLVTYPYVLQRFAEVTVFFARNGHLFCI